MIEVGDDMTEKFRIQKSRIRIFVDSEPQEHCGMWATSHSQHTFITLLITMIILFNNWAVAFPMTKKTPGLTAILPRTVLSRSTFPDDMRIPDMGRSLGTNFDGSFVTTNVWRSDIPSPLGLDYSQEKNTSKLILEAETLKAQAKAIMEQALAMEQELIDSRSKIRTSKRQEADECIQRWFRCSDDNDTSTVPANITVVACRLQEEKATPRQIFLVADRIFDLQLEVSGPKSFLEQQQQHRQNGDMVTTTSSSYPSYMTSQNNATMYELLVDMMEILLMAVAVVDENVVNRTVSTSTDTKWTGRVYSSLQSHLNQIRRIQQLNMERQLISQMETARVTTKMTTTGAPSSAVEVDAGRNILGNGNIDDVRGNSTTKGFTVERKIELVPLWVPSNFLPFIIHSQSSSLGPDEVNSLLNDVLMGSRFYVTSHNFVPGAAIFRGNVRGYGIKKKDNEKITSNEQPSALAFADMQRRLQKVSGLKDRVQLFWLLDPEWRPNKQGSNEENEPKPVILALSKSISPEQLKTGHGLMSRIGKAVLFPLVGFATFQYAIQGYALNQLFFNSVVKQRSLHLLMRTCMPICGGIFGLQVLQEVVHFLVAKRREIKIGPPIPIPSFAIGTFGCITPIRSFPPNRTYLLDFALSGPFATTIASIGCIVASIILTVRASPAALIDFPVVPAATMKSSYLTGILSSAIASKILLLPPAQPIPIHPLFLVGYSGLIASALNLLPIFRLDGGRACSAVMGSRQSAAISVSILLFLLSLALSGGSGLGFSWGMIVALFQRQQEIPPRDDVTEVDNGRLGLWFFSFLLAAGILTPFPGSPSIL